VLDAGGRHEARERALHLLYEAESRSVAPASVLAELPLTPDPYTADLVAGVADHTDELDALIGAYAKGWTLDRMPNLDRTVLRLGTFELVHRPDVPTGVVLSEAVELATDYGGTDDSGRYVNGVLGAIAKQVRGG
jgi:N utilization substance protein B